MRRMIQVENKEIDMTKPQPCNMFDVADSEAWGIELSRGVYVQRYVNENNKARGHF